MYYRIMNVKTGSEFMYTEEEFLERFGDRRASEILLKLDKTFYVM